VTRRSRGGIATRPHGVRLVDSEGHLPEPRLDEQLAVTIADRLPGFLVTTLGVRGLRALGWLLAAPLRLVGRFVGVRRAPVRPGGAP
jgi:hypothetical protein